MKIGRRKLGSLAAIALAHAALLAWLSLRPADGSPPIEPPGIRVGLFDAAALDGPAEPIELADAVAELDAAVAEVAATEPVRLLEPPPLAVPVFIDGPAQPAFAVDFTADPVAVGSALAPAAAPPAAGGADACALGDGLQSRLQGDQDARAAVARIPARARSVANAVMLWNGRWNDIGGPEVAPLRATIRDYVRKAPEACRAAAVSGPLLFYVSGEAKTTVLAVGSGLWRWSDLLEEPASGRDRR